MNSRYLAYEAQQAHYFGFPHNLALASVTSTPAKVMGIDHRVGYLKEGALRTVAVEKRIVIFDVVQDTTPVSVTTLLARSCRFIDLCRSGSLGQPPHLRSARPRNRFGSTGSPRSTLRTCSRSRRHSKNFRTLRTSIRKGNSRSSTMGSLPLSQSHLGLARSSSRMSNRYTYAASKLSVRHSLPSPMTPCLPASSSSSEMARFNASALRQAHAHRPFVTQRRLSTSTSKVVPSPLASSAPEVFSDFQRSARRKSRKTELWLIV